jgi:hypothetical protein
MSDFFGALELELHAAANRRPRRQVTVGQGLGVLASAALVAVAIGVVLALSGGGGKGDSAQITSGPKPDPVGTVISKGKGAPPRSQRSVVVAAGTVPYAGPWQLELQPSELIEHKGEVIQPAGLDCLWIYLLNPPKIQGPTASGYCGEQPRTPGFTRGQANLPNAPRRPSEEPIPTKQVLIYGRTPERAKYVVITVPGGLRMRRPVQGGPESIRGNWYLVAVPPRIGRGARINWLDEDEQPGSRGIRLLPPVSGKVRR